MAAPASITPTVAQFAGKLAHQLAPIAAAAEAASNDDALYRQLESAIDGCLAGLATFGVWGPENRLPSSELWNAAGHLLSRGWLQNQARTKPRGYAGDHELLCRIYERRLCDDPLGRLFDRY